MTWKASTVHVFFTFPILLIQTEQTCLYARYTVEKLIRPWAYSFNHLHAECTLRDMQEISHKFRTGMENISGVMGCKNPVKINKTLHTG